MVHSLKNESISKEVVSIDGKCIRGSKDGFHGQSPIHMVSAWAAENQLVLGQLKVDGKSNEITAIPLLLDLLDIEGSIITIDAIGTQTDIAAKIVGNKGITFFRSRAISRNFFIRWKDGSTTRGLLPSTKPSIRSMGA